MTDQKYKDLMNGGWSYPKKESTDPEEVKKVVDKYMTDNKIDSETIDKKITDGISKIVADAPEDFDTLKEMSDWISEHEDSAAAMNSAILDNKSSIDILKTDKANATDVETLSSEVENNTNDISEVNDSLSALGKCKNLLKTTLGSGNGNGITYVNNGNGTYTLNGTCTNTFELHFNPTLKLPYGKYKLLGTSAFQKDNNGSWKATLASGDIFEVSESKPVLDVIAYITSGSVVSKTFKPMVTTNLNATVNDFIPYTGDGDTLTADVAKVKNDVDALRTAIGNAKITVLDTGGRGTKTVNILGDGELDSRKSVEIIITSQVNMNVEKILMFILGDLSAINWCSLGGTASLVSNIELSNGELTFTFTGDSYWGDITFVDHCGTFTFTQ